MRKRFVWLVILLTVLLLLPVMMLEFHEKTAIDRLDNTDVNIILNDLEENWDTITAYAEEGSVMTHSQYGFDYVVLDNEGNVIRRTKRGMAEDLGRATTERYTIRDIEHDGEVLGKLLIENDFDSIRSDAYISYRTRYLIAVEFQSIIIILFLAWTYFSIVKPFEDLREFAADVAGGNLEKPLMMDRGNIFGAFTESFDLMRTELNDARQKEYEAQRSKIELVAQLSHDIKTPVASIKAMGEVLEARSEDQKSKEKLSSIVSKADQIDVMVSDLFATTLTDLNMLEAENTEQESNILDEIIRDADHMDRVVGDKVPECIISCDRVRTTQVINNIISNSYKYADTTITTSSRIEDDSLVLSFTDKGGGVSEDDLPMITKRFRRGDNSRGKPGAGLGLAIASELMEKMGGDLEVSNADGGFRVTLYFRMA
ncbi:MAG: HAMP domain-containing histidine kinase [Clostridiales bacterium]|nr:HAMP domain-containing histidine kinase [Clostridiales bacterium]